MITNTFKNIFRGLIMLSAFTLASCGDFLTEEPYDFITNEDLEDSQESVNFLVTGVYSKWCDDLFRYDAIPSGLEKDADYISGASWSFSALGAGNFQSSSEITSLWTSGYNLIDRCNTALEFIEPMVTPTDEAKANAIGEICFQKAYMYFLLTRAFGAIPLQDVSTYTLNKNGEKLYSGRKPIKEVYEEIIRLLEIAEEGLYAINDASYKVGHVASGTAAGMLAKVYATMASGAINDGSKVTVKSGEACDPSDKTNLYTPTPYYLTKNQVAGYESFDVDECYKKVIEYCEDLEAGFYGDYALLDFDDMWVHDSFNKVSGAEYMFTIYAVSGDELYGNKISRTYSYTTDETGQVFKGLWTGLRNHWYMLFEEEDRRINDGVLHRWVAYGKTYGTYFPRSTVSTVYSNKVSLKESPYNDGLSYSPASGSTNLAFTTKYFNVTDRTLEYSDAYYSMLRYADVLLLYAEALNETGTDLALSKELVTRVRARSLSTATIDDPDLATFDKSTLRSIIIEERAKELSCESDRRWDLIRWGIYVDAMNAIGGSDEGGIVKSRQDKHLLYPIPVDEILANEFITENNPGWN
ncbi:MAG: RagB/SusD family nutrient uptake outer membrane protein [Rikenellaceae bacterium]